MAVAERETAIANEMKRHHLVMALLSDPEALEGIQRALEEEQRGEFIPFSELRAKYGTRHPA